MLNSRIKIAGHSSRRAVYTVERPQERGLVVETLSRV